MGGIHGALDGLCCQSMRGIAFAALLLSISAFAQKEQLVRLLHTDWKLLQVGTQDTMDATVPGALHLDLIQNGRIEDPFYRTNEDSCQWVEKEDWTYFTNFQVSADMLERDRIELEFKGLDTYANVFLNGKLILEANNMFRTWLVDVKHLVRSNNQLRIEFRSPVKEHVPTMESAKAQLPAPNDAGDMAVSPYVRKAPYQFGWDWAPRLVGCGIWKPVVLRAFNGPAIRNLSLQADTNGLVRFQLDVHAQQEEVLWLKMQVDTLRDSLRIMVAPGRQTIKHSVQVAHPELWWPVGMGAQRRYRAKVQLEGRNGVVEVRKEFGFKLVELLENDDSVGRDFTFKFNGRMLFVRGANMVPMSMFPGTENTAQIEELLDDLLAANMNAVRVWGGGHYASNAFMSLCNQKGILVWQDLPFACSMYPGDLGFQENVQQEVVQNVQRMKEQPSLLAWCGNNEVEVAWHNWGWQNQYGIHGQDSIQIYRDNQFLFDTLVPQAIREWDTTTPYIASSPQSNWGKPENFNYGNMHYWGVWHGEEPIEGFQTNVGRFMSEYGMQSYPAWGTIESYTLPEERHFGSAVFNHHQKSYKGDGLIQRMVEDRYGTPSDTESLVQLSQILQAEAMTMAIDAHRLDKPRCMGSMYWQLNDVWPGPSWSTVDHTGQWKAAHYAVREAFKPVVLLHKEMNDSLLVYVGNSTEKEWVGQVQVRSHSGSGKTETKSVPVRAASGQKTEVLALTKDKKVDGLVLRDSKGILDRLCFIPPNRTKKSKVTMDQRPLEEGIELVLQCQSNTAWVVLDANRPGHFSDNYFPMFAGEEKVVVYQPDVAENVEFRVRTLQDLLD